MIPGLGRSPGGGHGTPLQYSCLENPHGQRSLVGYSTWGHKVSDMTEQLNTEHRTSFYINFRMGFSISAKKKKKKKNGILTDITLNLWITLGSADILILSLPIHEHGCVSTCLCVIQLSTMFCSFHCTSVLHAQLCSCISVFILLDIVVSKIVIL